MSSYNPFISAFHELTSDRAIAHYQKTAWAHSQRSIDDSIIVATYTAYSVYAFAQLAYTLGAAFGEGHCSAVSTHTTADQTCLPEPKAIAALPPAKVHHNTVNPIENEVIIVAPSLEREVNELIASMKESGQAIDAAQSSGLTVEDIKRNYTKNQMLRILRQYGHTVKANTRKADLAEMMLTLDMEAVSA